MATGRPNIYKLSKNVIVQGARIGGNAIFGGESHTITSQMQSQANISPIETALLQKGLKQFYDLEEEWYHPIEGLNARPTLLKDYYVELQFGEFHRNGRFKTKGTIPVEKVFLSRKSQTGPPTRILVTGEAGYGKSTLCKKLVLDWVENSEYISQFEIVILLRLRGVTSTIEESVVQLCNKAMGSKYEQEEVLQYLKQMGDRFLLILDGYDELKEEVKTSLERILKYEESCNEKFLKLATVLMTSRKENKFEEDAGNLLRKPLVGEKIGLNLSQSFQIFFNIDELTDSACILFIEKYFHDDKVKSESLKRNIHTTEMEIIRSPLSLQIICYLHEHGTVVNAHENFWEKYRDVISKRAVSREVGRSSNLNEQGIRELFLRCTITFEKQNS